MPRIVFEIIPSTPVGVVLVVSRGAVLAAVEIGHASPSYARNRARELFGGAAAPGRTRAGRQLREYFAGRRRCFDLEVEMDALGPFHARVLQECRKIPFGRLASYGELAAAAGSKGAARAVGQALKRNPAPVVIPCHRVVGARGPGGFSAAGGIGTKLVLLELEGVGVATWKARAKLTGSTRRL